MNEQQRLVAQQAVDALECICSPLHVREITKVGAAMFALRQLLEQPVQEPVAWIFKPNRELLWPDEVERKNPIELDEYAPLYTTPPAQPAAWVNLTDEEILEAAGIDGADTWIFETAYVIQAKLREKNGGKV